MNINKFVCWITVLVATIFIGNASAQMSAGNFKLSAGAFVGGGGTSTGASNVLTGSIPLSGSGVSSGGSFIMSGGVIATIGEPYAFNIFYTDSSEVEVVAGADYFLQVAFSGGRGADTVGQIFYRYGGQISYKDTSLSRNPGDTVFTFIVPGSALGIRGLEFYLKVQVGSDSLLVGEPTAPYLLICNLDNTSGRRPTPTPAKQYRIIGLPVDIDEDSSSVSTVFGDDFGAPDPIYWRLGSYMAALDSVIEYPDADSTYPGRGYWLITRAGKIYGSPGNSIKPDTTYNGNKYYRVPLDSGWNQLANPFAFTVDWDSLRFDTVGGWLDRTSTADMIDSAYYYNGAGYVTVDTIPAWEGVFFYMNRPGARAWFRYRESATVPKKPMKESKITKEYWAVNLRLEKNGLFDNGNFAGVRKDAKSGLDKYDFFEPPPPPAGPRLAFVLPDQSNGFRQSDFRPPFDDGATWDLDLKNASGGNLTVSNLDQIPEGMDAWLKLGNRAMMKLSENEPVVLPNDAKTAQLLICTKEFLDEDEPDLLPLTYELEQNYPNPFNPTTHIAFALPEPGKTSLAIYNILGQRVKTLINKEMPAGRYDVAWNGDNESGGQVASGVYFYRISHNSFSSFKKMLLLK